MDSLNTIFIMGSSLFFVSFIVLLVASVVRIKPYRKLYAIMLIIPLLAAIAYGLMSLSIGMYYLHGNELINVTRYAEWLLTTPLLLYILTRLMLIEGRSRNRTVLKLVVLDIIMVATGLFAELANGMGMLLWFGVSGAAFLAILYIITSSLLTTDRALEDNQARKIVIHLAWVVMVLWSIYPILWIMGVHVIALVDRVTENRLYLVLDLLAKVGFASLLLKYLYVSNKTKVL